MPGAGMNCNGTRPTANRPPTVLGTEAFAHKPSNQPAVLGTEASAPMGGLLPNTGAGALLGVAGLAGLALVGFGVVTMTRRRSTQN